MRPFGYLRDPLFLVCFSTYLANRILANNGMSAPLLRSYLNDVICMPFWVPIMLWIARKLGLRQHDGPPQAYEIVIPLLIWALVFEVLLPATRLWSEVAVADPNDVACYATGGLVAAFYWRWRYAGAEQGGRRRNEV